MLTIAKWTMRKVLWIATLTGLLSAATATAQFDPIVLADAEGDGVISEDEFTAYYALIWLVFTDGKPAVEVEQARPELRAMILSVLPEARGTVSRDEMLEAVAARYLDADKNGNGSVSMDEMKAWRAQVMATVAE